MLLWYNPVEMQGPLDGMKKRRRPPSWSGKRAVRRKRELIAMSPK
jgi:hypothetical protein